MPANPDSLQIKIKDRCSPVPLLPYLPYQLHEVTCAGATALPDLHEADFTLSSLSLQLD